MHKHPEHETKDKTELAKRSLVAHFAQVPDPRINLRTDHDLIDILVIAVCTLLCAGETFNDMEDFGKAKRDWFTHAFPNQAQHVDQLLAAFDKRRAAVIRKFYQQDWCARGLYHVLLNSAMGIDAMIAATQGAAGLKRTGQDTVRGEIGPTGASC